MTLSSLKEKAVSITAHPLAHATGRALQAVFILAVCYYLAIRITDIGWQEVTQSLPSTPWFYVFFIMMYFAFPVAEWTVYRRMWGKAVNLRFDVFLRMRIYNYAFVSYSGEAYIALWGSKNLNQSKRRTLATVKDSNILSALSSNALTLILLTLFFATGQLELITGADPSYSRYVAIAFGLSAVLFPLAVMLRGKIFYAEADDLRAVFGIHLTRLIAVVALQVGQWTVVMPYVSLDVWLLFLTAQYVLTRIPFLPNADLLFAGVGLTLLSYVDASQAILAGLFVASGALSQVLNLSIFAALGLRDILGGSNNKTNQNESKY
ncbi:hypothetical protein [Kordiimonas aquimaris]|uniref:hypothetical protein n=1 Tax=Kordiimonas aquimaris TaxID=707591 RepID=UPI0021D3431B|nr:hypothetical protein [Kordiimonas aquimaris]